MALLTSVGPFVQQFAESALTDGGFQVAEYGEIYRFLSLTDQFTKVGGYAYAIVGLLSGFAASGRRTPIGIAVAATLWLWGLLCAVDLAVTLRGAEAASPLPLQIVFNGAGAVIAGSILATLLCLAIAAGRTLSVDSRRAPFQFCIVVIGGLLVSGTAYALVSFTHRPAPSWIEVTASLPLSGWAIGATSRGALDDMRTLDWLPKNGVTGRLSAWTVKRPFVARWRPGENGSWRIGISAFGRCLSPNLAPLGRVPPQAVLDARSALAIRFDGDLTMLETDKHASVDLDLKAPYTQFSIEPGAEGRGPEVTNLTGAGVSARVQPLETTGLALSTSFLTGQTSRQMSQREFSIRGSRGSLRLLLQPTRFNPDQQACRPIRWRPEGTDPDGTRRFVADVDGSTAAVFLRIERFEEGPPSLRTRSAVLDVERLDAWVRVFDLDSAMLRLADFGTGEDVSFSGKVSSVFIDRQKIEIVPDDRFHVVGAVTGRWLEDGGVRLSGRADQFWRNGRLLSTTRWQRLTGELQVFLLGALGAALLVAARAALPFVQQHGSQNLG